MIRLKAKSRNAYLFPLLLFWGCAPISDSHELKTETKPSQLKGETLGETRQSTISFSEELKRIIMSSGTKHPEIVTAIFENRTTLDVCGKAAGLSSSPDWLLLQESVPDSIAYHLGKHQYLVQVVCPLESHQFSPYARTYKYFLFGANKGIKIDGGTIITPLTLSDAVLPSNKVTGKNRFTIESSDSPKYNVEQKTLTFTMGWGSFNQCETLDVYRLDDEKFELVKHVVFDCIKEAYQYLIHKRSLIDSLSNQSCRIG